MIHHMHLNEVPFEEIKKSLKTIEIRLCDEKRSKVQLEDIIEFTNRRTGEKLSAKVSELSKYKTYTELVEKTPLEYFGPRFKSKKEILKKGVSYWSEEEQKKYGFLVIHLEVCS